MMTADVNRKDNQVGFTTKMKSSAEDAMNE